MARLGGIGIIWFDLEIEGQAAHAESADRAVNPIEVAFRLVRDLRAWEQELNASNEDPAFAAGSQPYNLNVGTFHAAADESAGYRIARPVLRRAINRLSLRTAVSQAARDLVSRNPSEEHRLLLVGVHPQRLAHQARLHVVHEQRLDHQKDRRHDQDPARVEDRSCHDRRDERQGRPEERDEHRQRADEVPLGELPGAHGPGEDAEQPRGGAVARRRAADCTPANGGPPREPQA